ncbi:MAG: hypothetical protein KGL95_12910 [Patescibacteria group bacterium]|nr:hypothetical protein [Patescibacteria group bacterium]
MKPQDILFFLIAATICYKHNPKWAIMAGLVCLIISIPLFAKWVFFTAERLTWYGAGFFLLAVVFYFFDKKLHT